MATMNLGRALGYVSVGLGLAETLAPGFLQRKLGVRGHSTLMRTLGARELASGAAILARRRGTPGREAGLWSRVGGDAMDLALLAAAARKTRKPSGVAMAVAAVGGIALLDYLAARRATGQRQQGLRSGVFEGLSRAFGSRR